MAITSLEDIYNSSSKSNIVNARAQAAGQFSVNSVDPMNQTFAPGFTTRAPGDKRTWDNPPGSNTNFKPNAQDYYEAEIVSLGSDLRSGFTTDFNADAPDTQFIARFGTTPGVAYSL